MTRRPGFIACVAAGLLVGCKPPPAAPPTTAPATTTAADVVTEPVRTKTPAATVLDVVRLEQPDYPTKGPLSVPADLNDAAKIILDSPAYVDVQGTLWIKHPEGKPLVQALVDPVADHTVVASDEVNFFQSTGTDLHFAVVDREFGIRRLKPNERPNVTDASPASVRRYDVPPFTAWHNPAFNDAAFGRAQSIPGMTVVPAASPANGAIWITDDGVSRDIDCRGTPNDSRTKGVESDRPAVLANAGNGIWAWLPWDNNLTGGPAIFVDSSGPHATDANAGWPGKPIEIVPLTDGSVLVIAVEGADDAIRVGRGHAVVKLIAGAEKPTTGKQLRTIQPLARKLADRDPAARQAAQRELEKLGPTVLPVLEMMRDQLPPEAQIRIEAMLGQRFAPTIAGLRLLPGGVQTLARFPGGGCVLRFAGGGTIDADGDTPARSVIPATVLIRPGHSIELIDPESVCDFLPGRQSIQWVGDELLISDPTVGPRRWIGTSLSKPILPKDLADFDTVLAIDARRRWLLTSAKRPGKTLLIDPSLPDMTPKLPTWTIAGDEIGRTDAGWPAVRRGDRLFILEKSGWRVDKATAMRPLPLPLPTAIDRAGRSFTVDAGAIHATDVDGTTVIATIDGDVTKATPLVLPNRLLIYTPEGAVRRFAVGRGPLTLRSEAMFSQNVPYEAVVWIDPAGRVVMSKTKTMTLAFPEGRIPRELSDLMLNPAS